ncbi:AcrR family transcriptional regulator [Streptomyces griseochromogenes]|nr:TetR-like C-terminal domain-containing protein [Streptomyces griseochromogenes]MBP2055587.1 AcrR family transcriptional regulator [Streptomyces griseochromogenes]
MFRPRHANVAKSTVYRWWKSKGALVMDACTHTVVTRVPEPDTRTVAGDPTSFISDLYRISAYPLRGKALRGLMAEAQLDPAFAEHFRQWVQSRRAVVTRMLSSPQSTATNYQPT